jgi:hypothetical membrane protein
LSLCGIVVPPLDVLINLLVAAQQPGYDFVRDYVSDLAALGRPYSEVLCVWWALFPLQFGPFAVAVAAGLRGHRLARIPPTLLALFAVFMGLCGVFRFDPSSPEHTVSSQLHVTCAILASLALLPSPFFLWLATRRDTPWRDFHRFSLCLQAAGLVAGFFLVEAALHVADPAGLAERGFWAVYYIWIVGLAIKLRRMGASPL